LIAQEQIVGLTKQVFILEYLINGLFPCQSDVVRLIRAKKREWKFNNKFEYRMLLAVTNTGGSINSQIFRENVGLNQPGTLDYGLFNATCGQVADGFDIDMMFNLETKEKQAAFENDYATRMHSLRTNVASLFKNFAIHGQYGVVHQLNVSILAPNINAAFNPVANTGFTPTPATATTPGTPFTIKVPTNVFQSNFKRGRFIIKTIDGSNGALGPWGTSNVSELYMIIDNQPGVLSLCAVGLTTSEWQNGEFLEIQGNREIVGQPNPSPFRTDWNGRAMLNVTGVGSAFNGTMVPIFNYTGSAVYTNYVLNTSMSIVGAMEGLADLFPWYCALDTNGNALTRLGLDIPFRGQPNRLQYSTEQAGGFIMQQNGENIIDVIMRGAFLTKATVPYAEIGVWMNPITRIQMGYQEGDNVRVLRDNFVQGPIVWQRGTKTTDYQIGSQVVKEIVEDLNMPTDVIVIGPKDDMSYNCWDNTIFQIDEYIQQLWAKTPPKRVEDISIPDELLTKMDLSNRIIYGSPAMNDGGLADFSVNSSLAMGSGSNIRHPKNSLPVALLEAGALFTEYPYTYTICKLQQPILDLATV